MQAADNLVKEFTQKIGMTPMGLDGDKQRSLSFDDKLVVSFIGEQDDHLVAICYIGDLKKDADMRMFLEQNFMPEAHGGARFALEPESPRITLNHRWNAARISVEQFSNELEGFVNSAMRAQEFLAKGGMAEKKEATADGAVAEKQPASDSLAYYQNM